MRKSKTLLMLFLITTFVLSCQKTLAGLPDELKPVTETVKDIPVVSVGTTENFFCTDRPGAEKIAVAFRENADCHYQLKEGNIDWGVVVLTATFSLFLGYELGYLTTRQF